MPITPANPITRVLKWRYLFVVNLLALALLGVAFGREWVRSREIRTQIADLRAQSESLQARNIEIAQLATMLQTESAIEREARLKLGYKKPGETAVVVKRDAEATRRRANAPDAITDPDGVPNPNKWWFYFFDHPRYAAVTRTETDGS